MLYKKSSKHSLRGGLSQKDGPHLGLEHILLGLNQNQSLKTITFLTIHILLQKYSNMFHPKQIQRCGV